MSRTINSTPRKDAFCMPGEFEAHAGTWMLWPQRTDNWRLGGKPAQKAFSNVAIAIAAFEPVTMGVNHNQFQNARTKLPPEIRVVELSNNDSWMRDCGPTFVKNAQGAVRGIDWDFNAWGGLEGGLYFPWDLDDMVPQKVLEIEKLERYKAPIILEGGSIHVDGQGTLITTAECLLNPNRNPSLSKVEIEETLKEYCNVEKVIWIPRGVFEDETNGHVDNLCCFLRPGVLALTWTDDRHDPQYERSLEAYELLSQETDARGRHFEVHKIHQPDPVLIRKDEAGGVDEVEGTMPRTEGLRLAASYINFYFCNGGAVVPSFGDAHDKLALDALQRLLPEYKLASVPAREILLGGGNIHCITQQQPR